MGIKHFFSWFKYNYPNQTTYVSKKHNVNVDILLLDMNGLYHTATQKVYGYGEFKSLLVRPQPSEAMANYRIVEDILNTINNIVRISKPKKAMVVCIDGVAPLSKQNQQRQRRFKSAQESNTLSFDGNSITTGTKFMDNIGTCLQRGLKERFNHLDIYFSSEKVPGEGEHKLMDFVRSNPFHNYCIYGPDADLIMLTLVQQVKQFYLIREDHYRKNYHYLINITQVRKLMIKEGINPEDFITIGFLFGNDFLPHLPSLEIIQGGLNTLIDLYKEFKKPLTLKVDDHYQLHKENLLNFFNFISDLEPHLLQYKVDRMNEYFTDNLMMSHVDENGNLHYSEYVQQYNDTHYPRGDPKFAVTEYLRGMQWVLEYYIHGNKCWKWTYPYDYAPFLKDFNKWANYYTYKSFYQNSPLSSVEQLLCVLPPKSAKLLPPVMQRLLTTQLKQYCPLNVQVDLSGFRQEWEGKVLVPRICVPKVQKLFKEYKQFLSKTEKNRNSRHFGFKHL